MCVFYAYSGRVKPINVRIKRFSDIMLKYIVFLKVQSLRRLHENVFMQFRLLSKSSTRARGLVLKYRKNATRNSLFDYLNSSACH